MLLEPPAEALSGVGMLFVPFTSLALLLTCRFPMLKGAFELAPGAMRLLGICFKTC